MAASTSFENRNQSGVDVALRNVEGRYQTFVEAALDEIYVFSRDGRIQYLNRAAAARLHRAASDVIGQRVQNLISAGPPAATWEDVQRVLDARTPIYTEREFTLPDRTTFWQSIWLIPLAQDQGLPVKAVPPSANPEDPHTATTGGADKNTFQAGKKLDDSAGCSTPTDAQSAGVDTSRDSAA